ncbi:hypothetical protein [Methanohalophilus sp.]
MDLTTITQIDTTILFGIAVGIIIMSLATLYDRYTGAANNGSEKLPSNPFGGIGQILEIAGLKASNPFAKYIPKIKEKLARFSDSTKSETSETATQQENLTPSAESNDAGAGKPDFKAYFDTLKYKLSGINFSLPGRGNKETQPGGESGAEASAVKEADVSFDADEIAGDKKQELDFDDNLISEMESAEDMDVGGEVSEESAGLDEDLSIDMDDFDFGFDAGDGGQSDEEDLGLNLPEEDPSDDDSSLTAATDEISFEDDNDDFMESLKKDIVIEKEDKIDFMSAMEGQNLDIGEIKSELQEVLTTLNKYKDQSK